MGAWLGLPATQEFLSYLRSLLADAERTELDLPATETIRISEQKGRRAVLEAITERRTFLQRLRVYFESKETPQ